MNDVLHALCEPDRVRNVCVIAHVDHGKTSICDHLVASNGYITAKLAGKTRYMDSRDDEQQRLITIKSSSIPLLYKPQGSDREPMVVNLIDSPGHVDFSVEVSAATRLCDNALVVVDVVEGLRSQTKTVLRQAVSEGLALLLVLNKVDRLFSEIRMTPGGAYVHLCYVIETLNAYLHKCVQDAYHGSAAEIDEIHERLTFDPSKGNVVFCSAMDGWCFDVRVIARRLLREVSNQTEVDSAKLDRMAQVCWGDWTYNAKTGQVKRKSGHPDMTIAATQMFRPLEQIYKLSGVPASEVASSMPELVQKIAKFLEVDDKISERDLRDWLKKPTSAAAGLLGKWSPLGPFLLGAIVQTFQSPVGCFQERMEKICAVNPSAFRVHSARDLADAPTVVFIAKSVHANFEQRRLTTDCLHGRETVNDFVGFSRIFQGRLRVGDVLFPSGSRQNTLSGESRAMPVRKLFVPVGMELIPTEEVAAGAIVCIAFEEAVTETSSKSLEDTVKWLLSLKNTAVFASTDRNGGFTSVDRCVTMASSSEHPPFLSIYSKQPMGTLRFGMSPVNLTDWQVFVNGLALLYRADPAVSIEIVSETGEFVICCQGGVHHERIVRDFQNLYCRDIPLVITPPLLSVRETLVAPPVDLKLSSAALSLPFPPWSQTSSPVKPQEWQWSIVAEASTAPGQFTWVKARALPMQENLLRFLDDEVGPIADILHLKEVTNRVTELCARIRAEVDISPSEQDDAVDTCHALILRYAQHLSGLKAECVAVSVTGDGRTAAFLALPENAEWPAEEECVNATPSRAEPEELRSLGHLVTESNLRAVSVTPARVTDTPALPAAQPLKSTAPRVNAVVTYRRGATMCVRHALDSVTRRGPICEEPVRGVCWVVSSMMTVCMDESECAEDSTTTVQVASLGPLIGSTLAVLRQCMLARGCVRIWELMAKLEVSCSESSLGCVHDVLASRRGTVLAQDMLETTLEFVLIVELPASEAVNLALEMRKHAAFVPINTRWQLKTEDPFEECVATSSSEEFGTPALAMKPNTARRLIQLVRERKGLPLGLKLLEGGVDKQRTLKR